MEIWKEIGRTNGAIEVSSYGRLRSNLRTKGYVLKVQPDKKGYLRARVTIDGEKITLKVHQEVAKAFLPNPDNLPQVNHKDGNKGNNCVDNLEWITCKDNARHAIENGLWDTVIEGARLENERRKKPVIGKCSLPGKTAWKYFDSVSDAERFFDSRHISDVLKGKRSTVKGWSFTYANEGVISHEAAS